MIDTHAHLLPYIDDGSASVDESLAMAREAVRSGITDVVCTPHLRDPNDPVATQAPEALEQLRAALATHDIPLRLHLGYEVTFPFLIAMQGQDLYRFTLGDSQYLLVEVPHAGWPAFARDLVFELQLKRLVPVLAHPERNDRIQRDPQLLGSLLQLGAVAQGTVSSFNRHFGASARRTLLKMLSAGQISLLATDAHHYRSDTWSFDQGGALTGWDPEAVAVLTQENPGRLLQGLQLRPAPRVVVDQGLRGSIRRLFG